MAVLSDKESDYRYSIDIAIGCLIILALSFYLYFEIVSRHWLSIYRKQLEVSQQLKPQATAEDAAFRHENGYSWDFVIAFKVYDGDEALTEEQMEFSMKYVLKQLDRGHLEYRLFYSLCRNTVFCKVRASKTRLLCEMDRIGFKLEADPQKLHNICALGRPGYWSGFQIPEKSPETTIGPYEHMYFEYVHVVTPQSQRGESATDMTDFERKERLERMWRQKLNEMFVMCKSRVLAEVKSNRDDLEAKGNHMIHFRSNSAASDAKPWMRPSKTGAHPWHTIKQNIDEDFSVENGLGVFELLSLKLKSSVRLKLIDSVLNSAASGCCDLDVEHLVKSGCILAAFPTQSALELEELEKNWIKFRLSPSAKDLHMLKEYFGEKIGLYFVFLKHFFLWSIVLAVVGIVMHIYDAAQGVEYKGYQAHSPVALSLGGVLTILSFFMIGTWRRTQYYTAMRWGTTGVEQAIRDKKGPIEFQPRARDEGTPLGIFLKDIQSTFIRNVWFVAAIVLKIGLIVCLFVIRYSLIVGFPLVKQIDLYSTVTFGVLNAFIIIITKEVHYKYSPWLYDALGYRTETEMKDAFNYDVKVFFWVDLFLPYFYITAINPVFGESVCIDGDCITEGGLAMGTVFFVFCVLQVGPNLLMPIIRGHRSFMGIKRQLTGVLGLMSRYNDSLDLFLSDFNYRGSNEPADVDEENPHRPSGSYREIQNFHVSVNDFDDDNADIGPGGDMGSMEEDERNIYGGHGIRHASSLGNIRTQKELNEKREEIRQRALKFVSEAEFIYSQPVLHDSEFELYYNLMVLISLGICYGWAFPLSIACTTVVLLLAMRVDSMRVCHTYRRAIPESATTIGLWMSVMEIANCMSIVTYTGGVAMGALTLQNLSWSDRLLIFITLTIILFSVKILVHCHYARVPKEVAIQLARQEFITEKIIHNINDHEEDEGSIAGIRIYPKFLVHGSDPDPL